MYIKGAFCFRAVGWGGGDILRFGAHIACDQNKKFSRSLLAGARGCILGGNFINTTRNFYTNSWGVIYRNKIGCLCVKCNVQVVHLHRSAKYNKIESIGENDFEGLTKLQTL